ncbi:prolyl oligopeptidase family protein, putative [Ichthyophthirius multifiliis]|uniref:Prolyl oligopeptidase family protein, putative n=1 Tax=Ichthyophthirius multifiliis TaxID=5932 RepID=G0QYE0_ICHMU|nr:prolyl oligopeptidase family protein, putative [Ichthyophthirius multifiliis]EGR29765.1 prolyl oligopeptidase family protein, putative [Ichthyophthirius multifiliis]|eukprot:XP_004031001.1 prolyl oligopeptidase family protein, putative [Ichthyophthirius multifiliis]
MQIYIVNTENKEVFPISKNETLSDVFQLLQYDQVSGILYASFTNMKNPLKVVFANLDLNLNTKVLSEKIEWKEVSLINNNTNIIFQIQQNIIFEQFEERLIKQGEAEGFFWKLKKFENQNIPNELKELYENNEKINPLKYSQDNQRPLVVMVHGGPHGSSAGNFGLLRLYFLLQGYGILAPNYTGSCGYGQNFMEKLLTNIGDIDAQEILGMIDQIIQKGLCDPKKIIIIGGSYGGFMTGIMATRHAEKFLCGILMNPVVNINFNLNASDIPEWSTAECFNRKNNWNLSPEDYRRMFEISPASQINKLPSINFIGVKDRRVPYQQSIAFHSQCLQNGCDFKTYVYPEADHSLDDCLNTVFDVLMKSILFIEGQLLK